jgi:hypothetical protein
VTGEPKKTVHKVKAKTHKAKAAAHNAKAKAAADQLGAFPPASWPLATPPAELAGDGRLVVVANASAIGHSADLHPTTPDDWGRVHQLLEAGEIWRAASGEVSVFGRFTDAAGKPQLWAVALKPVEGAWRVRTLFPTSPRRRAKITQGRTLLRASRGRLELGGE